MDFTKKISLEKISGKLYKIKSKEPENNKEAVLTHYLHNHFNGVEKYILGVSLRVGLSVPIFLFVPHKKDFHCNP